MYILSEYYSDLSLNKICFWHFITMSQSTKRRWNSSTFLCKLVSECLLISCSPPKATLKLELHRVQNARSFPNELDCNQWCDFFHSSWNLQLYFFKKAVSATNKTPQLHQFMPTKSVDDQVTRAENLFSNFVAEHNSCN
jgi:hypothetical protein